MLQHLRNKTNTNAPAARDLSEGQLAINLITQKLFTKDHNGDVITLNQFVEVVESLTETSSGKALDATQGKALKDMIDDINTLLASDDTTLDELQEVVDFIKANKSTLDNLSISNIAGLQDALDGKEDAFSKNTAFNKNFGTGSDEVARGDHTHDDGYYD